MRTQQLLQQKNEEVIMNKFNTVLSTSLLLFAYLSSYTSVVSRKTTARLPLPSTNALKGSAHLQPILGKNAALNSSRIKPQPPLNPKPDIKQCKTSRTLKAIQKNSDSKNEAGYTSAIKKYMQEIDNQFQHGLQKNFADTLKLIEELIQGLANINKSLAFAYTQKLQKLTEKNTPKMQHKAIQLIKGIHILRSKVEKLVDMSSIQAELEHIKKQIADISDFNQPVLNGINQHMAKLEQAITKKKQAHEKHAEIKKLIDTLENNIANKPIIFENVELCMSLLFNQIDQLNRNDEFLAARLRRKAFDLKENCLNKCRLELMEKIQKLIEQIGDDPDYDVQTQINIDQVSKLIDKLEKIHEKIKIVLYHKLENIDILIRVDEGNKISYSTEFKHLQSYIQSAVEKFEKIEIEFMQKVLDLEEKYKKKQYIRYLTKRIEDLIRQFSRAKDAHDQKNQINITNELMPEFHELESLAPEAAKQFAKEMKEIRETNTQKAQEDNAFFQTVHRVMHELEKLHAIEVPIFEHIKHLKMDVDIDDTLKKYLTDLQKINDIIFELMPKKEHIYLIKKFAIYVSQAENIRGHIRKYQKLIFLLKKEIQYRILTMTQNGIDKKIVKNWIQFYCQITQKNILLIVHFLQLKIIQVKLQQRNYKIIADFARILTFHDSEMVKPLAMVIEKINQLQIEYRDNENNNNAIIQCVDALENCLNKTEKELINIQNNIIPSWYTIEINRQEFTAYCLKLLSLDKELAIQFEDKREQLSHRLYTILLKRCDEWAQKFNELGLKLQNKIAQDDNNLQPEENKLNYVYQGLNDAYECLQKIWDYKVSRLELRLNNETQSHAQEFNKKMIQADIDSLQKEKAEFGKKAAIYKSEFNRINQAKEKFRFRCIVQEKLAEIEKLLARNIYAKISGQLAYSIEYLNMYLRKLDPSDEQKLQPRLNEINKKAHAGLIDAQIDRIFKIARDNFSVDNFERILNLLKNDFEDNKLNILPEEKNKRCLALFQILHKHMLACQSQFKSLITVEMKQKNLWKWTGYFCAYYQLIKFAQVHTNQELKAENEFYMESKHQIFASIAQLVVKILDSTTSGIEDHTEKLKSDQPDFSNFITYIQEKMKQCFDIIMVFNENYIKGQITKYPEAQKEIHKALLIVFNQMIDFSNLLRYNIEKIVNNGRGTKELINEYFLAHTQLLLFIQNTYNRFVDLNLAKDKLNYADLRNKNLNIKNALLERLKEKSKKFRACEDKTNFKTKLDGIHANPKKLEVINESND